MDYPTKVKVNDRYYDINTSYKVAIECNEIAEDTSIGDYERVLAIIYKLFGDKGLENAEDYESLMTLGLKYLSCNMEIKESKELPDMDYVEDMDYIKASFRSDYNINIDKEDLHWWEFNNLINGLSYSEMGNCCVLNRIRYIRNLDTSKISDPEEKRKMEEAKEQVSLRKNKKHKHFTQEENENINQFYELMGIKREE